MKYYAIIVGGGSGTRMQSDIPKQFLLLKGRPVLMHTIEAFYHSDLHPEIIVVLNVDFHPYWEQLCAEHKFEIPHQLIKAGSQRFFSVKNGLKAIKSEGIIAVHDAVRPVISNKVISNAFREGEKFGTAITAVASKDSVRQVNGEISVSLNREDIFLVQTPQVFQSKLLKKAYTQPYRSAFTDDATVVEKAGIPVRLIEGDYKNLKITFPEDLLLAELLISGSNS